MGAKAGATENLLLVGFFVVVLLVTPYSSIDPINLPKMTALGIFSITLMALTIPKLRGSTFYKNKSLYILCSLFALHLLLVLIFSGRNITENFYGIFGRNTGVLTYLSFLIILFTSAILVSQVMISRLISMFLLLGGILIFYGAIQHFGLEPFPYVYAYESKVIGTFGNPNFHSAFMGVVGAIAFANFWNTATNGIVRFLTAMIFLFSIFSISSTNSWQGFFNLIAGVGVAIVLLAYQRGWYKAGNSFLVAGVFAIGMVGLGLLNSGPLADILSKASLTARRFYWEAALKMLSDRPLFGVGLDGFGDWYRRSRSLEAIQFSPGLVSDSAHSVPLEIAAGGGFPLLMIYLGLLILTLHSIVKVVRKKSNLSFGFISISAAWISYQTQSLISINQIALGFIGWTLSGLIIGYASLSDSELQVEASTKISKHSANTKIPITFASFVAPIVGFILGCLISLPPFIASNRFYESLRTSDARVVVEKAYSKPLDARRLLMTVSILERNKFHQESLKMTKFASQEFPDSYEVWTTLMSLTNASDTDKRQATKELSRLEPNLQP
jgi:O-antigen ligase